MLSIIKKALSVPVDAKDQLKDLLKFEGRIGGELFGPVPENHERQFFCLDEHTWVWHEAWKDKSNRWQSVTTRYEVTPHGIFKIQPNLPHRRLSDEELRNFYQAVKLYGQKVPQELERLAQG